MSNTPPGFLTKSPFMGPPQPNESRQRSMNDPLNSLRSIQYGSPNAARSKPKLENILDRAVLCTDLEESIIKKLQSDNTNKPSSQIPSRVDSQSNGMFSLAPHTVAPYEVFPLLVNCPPEEPSGTVLQKVRPPPGFGWNSKRTHLPTTLHPLSPVTRSVPNPHLPSVPYSSGSPQVWSPSRQTSGRENNADVKAHFNNLMASARNHNNKLTSPEVSVDALAHFNNLMASAKSHNNKQTSSNKEDERPSLISGKSVEKKQKKKNKKKSTKPKDKDVTDNTKPGDMTENSSRSTVKTPDIISKILKSDDEQIMDEVQDENPEKKSAEENQESEAKKKKKKKNKSKKKQTKFEDYFTQEMVNIGLSNGTLVQGELRISDRNQYEAFISDPNKGEDIFINGIADRNRALEGDIAIVKIKEMADWIKQSNGTLQRTGQVVNVSKRVHHGRTVGTLKLSENNIFILVPRDQKFPLLRIARSSMPPNIRNYLNNPENIKNISNCLYDAVIVQWNVPQYAIGCIQGKVGYKGDLEAESAAIIVEVGLNHNPISEGFNRFLPKIPFVITEEEIKSRLDLRSETIFTIDPATAKDLDDAVSLKKVSEDRYEVGVHISDVAYFLHQGTPLDVEVSKRATTIYMVHKAFHMLPEVLCKLCSLLPGEDKFAFSVIFILDIQGNILETKFTKTVIHSCAQFTYDFVQDIIDGKQVEFPSIQNDNSNPENITESIITLNKIALNLRRRRFESGALKIDQPKVCFHLSPDNAPQSMFTYEAKDSNRMIEEFMLLANEAVAGHIRYKYPEIALLRRHDPPKADLMTKVETSLQKLGIFLDTSSASSLNSSLLKYCNEDPQRAHVLNRLCAKTMNRAVYFCHSEDSLSHHYALNKELYTHFTSPIRRYADIIVHRLLAASLGYTGLPPWTEGHITDFATTCNRNKWAAKKADNMSCNLFRQMYIKSIGGIIAEAVITNVNSRSIDVILPSMAFFTRVYIEKLKDVTFEFNDNDLGSSISIKWPDRDSIQVLQMFCSVKLHLTVPDKSSKIDAKLLPPEPVFNTEGLNVLENVV